MININPVFKKEIISTSRSMKLPIFVLIVNVLCAVAFFAALLTIDNSAFSENEYENIGQIEELHYKMMNARTYYDVAQSGSDVGFVIMFFLAMEFLAMYLVIPSYCASAIAEERQQQTFEMLITTGYSRKRIILGKMAGGVAVMFIYIAASLPFLIGMLGMYSVTIKRLFIILAGMVINGFFCAGVGAFAGSKAKNTKSSGVMGVAWIIAINFLSVVIPAAWYGIKNLIVNYDYYFGYNPEYVEVSVGPIKYLTLLNPFMSVYSLIVKATDVDLTVGDLTSEFGVDLNMYRAVENNWSVISMFFLILMGTGFFLLASRRINPLKKLCRYKRKIMEQ